MLDLGVEIIAFRRVEVIVPLFIHSVLSDVSRVTLKSSIKVQVY
jgi:hypothetical protein